MRECAEGKAAWRFSSWHPVQRRSSIAAVMELDVHAGPLLHDGSGIGAVTVGGLLTGAVREVPGPRGPHRRLLMTLDVGQVRSPRQEPLEVAPDTFLIRAVQCSLGGSLSTNLTRSSSTRRSRSLLIPAWSSTAISGLMTCSRSSSRTRCVGSSPRTLTTITSAIARGDRVVSQCHRCHYLGRVRTAVLLVRYST